MIKTILLHAPLHTADPERGPVSAGLELARQHGASITALLFDYQQGPAQPSADQLHHALGSAAEELGVALEVITTHSHAHGIHEVVADHARLHDLVVGGADGRGLLPERQVTEHLIFESGRPVLLVPSGHRGFNSKRAMVAWDGSKIAARALGDAMPLLQRAGAVGLVHLTDDKPLRGSLTYEEVEERLVSRGLAAQFRRAERGRRNTGAALGEEALAAGAGLLVMGACTRAPLRDRLFGGATRAVLDGPMLPTLLSS